MNVYAVHTHVHIHIHTCVLPFMFIFVCFFIMLLSSPLTLKTLSFDRFHIKAAANKLNALRG